jgi:hypothetical protein
MPHAGRLVTRTNLHITGLRFAMRYGKVELSATHCQCLALDLTRVFARLNQDK